MEHSRNTLGIREFFKRKNPSTPPPKNLKGKKARHLEPSHWLHEISHINLIFLVYFDRKKIHKLCHLCHVMK